MIHREMDGKGPHKRRGGREGKREITTLFALCSKRSAQGGAARKEKVAHSVRVWMRRLSLVHLVQLTAAVGGADE